MAVMIQKEMKLHDPFGASELHVGKQRQTTGYDCAIHGKQSVLEPEFVFPWGYVPAHGKGLTEEISKQLPGAMGVGIREDGFLREHRPSLDV